MEEKKTSCNRCGSYAAYYKKMGSGFYRESCGFCKMYKKVVKNHDGAECPFWKNNHSERVWRKRFVYTSLSAISEQLSEIIQLLNEEKKEAETDPIGEEL